MKDLCGVVKKVVKWYYWSEEEAEALKLVSGLVLDYQWDSSGYSIMLRAIQEKFI